MEEQEDKVSQITFGLERHFFTLLLKIYHLRINLEAGQQGDIVKDDSMDLTRTGTDR